MALSANLQASFGADGFDLDASLSGLGDVFAGVQLPTLALDAPATVDLESLSLDGVLASVGDLDGVIGGALDGFPDVGELLAPLGSATALLELVGGTDFAALQAELETRLRAPEAGLAELVAVTTELGSLEGPRRLADGLAAFGLDLRAPGSILGGAAGGIVSLVQLVGALMGVEATSAEIERRIALSADLLAADRLVALTGQVRAAGGPSLAGLLEGIDPDDPGVVEIVAGAVETYAGLVRELVDLIVRGVAFAEATVVHADFPALSLELGVATAGLQEAALAQVRTLVASARPAIDQVAALELPDVGPQTLVDASAQLAAQLQALVDGVAPTAVSGLLDPVLDPVMAPVRAINDQIEAIVAAIDAAFDPIREALQAIDLAPVRDAIAAVTAPVQDAIDALQSLLTASQAEVQEAVDAVVAALAPVRDALTSARDAIAAPFARVHAELAALDLDALQATLEQTVSSVASAVASAPVRPVFDVASGAISTAADAVALVPRSLLPDDVKAELDSACATISSLELEPTRTLLHEELDEIIASIDATALEAVQAGYAAVEEFVASVNPKPLVAQLESEAFAALSQRLDAIDPATLLAEPLAALERVRGALDGIDVEALLAPVEEALATVTETIASLEPAELVAPVEEALAGARATVTGTLRLDEWTAQLEALDAFVAAFAERADPTPLLAELQSRWSALLAPLREPGPSPVESLLGGLLGPGAGLSGAGGFLEVLAWVRDVRNGAEVVRGRLQRAAARASETSAALGALDLPAVSAELVEAYAALTAAVGRLPAESLLRGRLEVTVAATDPRPDLAVVAANLQRAAARFGEAAATIAATTPPDRSEVSLIAAGLASAFAPAAPVLEKGREALRILGIDSLEGGLGPALADALEEIGPEPILKPFAAVVRSTRDRLTELVHDGVVVPLTEGVAELQALIDALSVTRLLAGIQGVRADLLALVEGVRPSVVLADPIATFESLRATLRSLDPLAPLRIAVDTLRATVDTFTSEFAPSRLLAPVVTVYDDLAALVGAFDVAGLLEPVLTALRELGRQIDAGMDEVIDALARLQEACASGGGALPDLDLAISGSVEVGGGLGF